MIFNPIGAYQSRCLFAKATRHTIYSAAEQQLRNVNNEATLQLCNLMTPLCTSQLLFLNPTIALTSIQ